MELEGVYVEGRHASDGVSALRNKNMTVSASCYEDSVTLRIDDQANLPFWLQVTIPRSQLEAMLKAMDRSDDGEPQYLDARGNADGDPV